MQYDKARLKKVVLDICVFILSVLLSYIVVLPILKKYEVEESALPLAILIALFILAFYLIFTRNKSGDE